MRVTLDFNISVNSIFPSGGFSDVRSQREIGFTFDYCVRLVEGHQRVYLRDVREPSQVGPDSDGTWVLCAMSVASYEALCKRLIAIWNSEYHLVSDEERQAAHASAN